MHVCVMAKHLTNIVEWCLLGPLCSVFQVPRTRQGLLECEYYFVWPRLQIYRNVSKPHSSFLFIDQWLWCFQSQLSTKSKIVTCFFILVLLNCVYLYECLFTNWLSFWTSRKITTCHMVHFTVIVRGWIQSFTSSVKVEKINILGLKLEHGHYGWNKVVKLCNMSVHWFWSWASEGFFPTTLMTNL